MKSTKCGAEIEHRTKDSLKLCKPCEKEVRKMENKIKRIIRKLVKKG